MITMDKRLVVSSVAIATVAAVLSVFVTGSQSTPNSVVAARYSDQFAQSGAPGRMTTDFAALTRQAAAALEELKKKQQANPPSERLILNTRADCQQQTWPNIASDCLVRVNGAPARQPARYISTDRAKRTDVAAL